MTEFLNAFNQDGRLVKVAERKQLLKEIREESDRRGDVGLAVEVVYLILLNSRGELYVVRRGDKPENPWLLDKTVGGHVNAGESYNIALWRETREEIGTEVMITDMLDFHQLSRHCDKTRYAVVRAIDHIPWMPSIRTVSDGRPWLKRHRVMLYAGIYDGAVSFADGEATELRLISKPDLRNALHEEPGQFTDDLRFLMTNYDAFF